MIELYYEILSNHFSLSLYLLYLYTKEKIELYVQNKELDFLSFLVAILRKIISYEGICCHPSGFHPSWSHIIFSC